MRISAATSNIVTSTRSSTAWRPGSAIGRIRHSTATCGRSCFPRIGRATSRLRATSASAFEPVRRNALRLLRPTAYPVCYDINSSHVFGDGNLMLRIEVEEETDGRFIAEVPDLPGVMAYGQSRDEAIVKVEALALRVLADRVENGEPVPGFPQIFSAA